MGVNKRVHTVYHLSGTKGFAAWSKDARKVALQIIKERHDPIRRQEVIGDVLIMLGVRIKDPIVAGNYLVFDATANLQTYVRLSQSDFVWYVYPLGWSTRIPLTDYNQRYFRWVLLYPLDEEVLIDLKRHS